MSREARELNCALVAAAFGFCLNTFFGESNRARIGVATLVALGCAFLIVFILRRDRPASETHEHPINKNFTGGPKWNRHRRLITTFALFFLIATTSMLAVKMVYKSGLTLEGQLHGVGGEPLPSDITILLLGDNPLALQFTTPNSNGKFQFHGLTARRYQMIAYRHYTNKFAVKEFSRDLRDVNDSSKLIFHEEFNPDNYTVVSSTAVYFDTGVSDLDSGAQSKVFQLLSSLSNRQYRLAMFGNTDETGTESRNIDLSKQRALQPFCTMTNGGATGWRAFLAGFGSDQPAKYGNSAADLQLNRRTEIFVLFQDSDSK